MTSNRAKFWRSILLKLNGPQSFIIWVDYVSELAVIDNYLAEYFISVFGCDSYYVLHFCSDRVFIRMLTLVHLLLLMYI